MFCSTTSLPNIVNGIFEPETKYIPASYKALTDSSAADDKALKFDAESYSNVLDWPIATLALQTYS